jgi:hypothetical protein
MVQAAATIVESKAATVAVAVIIKLPFQVLLLYLF